MPPPMSKVMWVVVVSVLGCGPVTSRADADVEIDAGRAGELDSLGFVEVLTSVMPSTAPTPIWGTQSTADFLNPDDFACAREEMGSCVRFECRAVTATWGPKTTAGALRVGTGSSSHPLDPNDAGVYPLITVLPPPWSAAEAIRVSAAGRDGGVPPFTATLVVPPKIKVTSPTDFDRTTFPDVSVDVPYRVTWTGGEGATVAVVIMGGSALGRTFCTAPGAAGALEVPSAVVQPLRGSGGFIAVGAESRVELQVGRWTVLTYTLWSGETATGAAYTGAVFR